MWAGGEGGGVDGEEGTVAKSTVRSTAESKEWSGAMGWAGEDWETASEMKWKRWAKEERVDESARAKCRLRAMRSGSRQQQWRWKVVPRCGGVEGEGQNGQEQKKSALPGREGSTEREAASTSRRWRVVYRGR